MLLSFLGKFSNFTYSTNQENHYSYAIKDVTEKIMCRVTSPFEIVEEEKEAKEAEEESAKYKIAAPKTLQSKFLAMMKQRELDKIKAEEERQAKLEHQRILVISTNVFFN